MIVEKVHPNNEVTLTVGKFTFTTDGNTVIVHNNAGEMPIFIRSNDFKDEDDAYRSAWKQANLQSKA